MMSWKKRRWSWKVGSNAIRRSLLKSKSGKPARQDVNTTRWNRRSRPVKRLYFRLLIITSVTLLVAVGATGVKRIIRTVQVARPEGAPLQSSRFEPSEKTTAKNITADSEPSL